MALPTLTLNLEDLMAGEENIPQQIIERAAQVLSKECSGAAEDRIHKIVEEEFRSTIKEFVAAKFTEAFESQLVETDNWGNPRRNGKAVTLNEVLLDQIKHALGEKVDQYGNRRYDGTPLIQAIVNKAVSEAIDKDLKPQIAAAKDATSKAIKERLGQIFAEAVKSAIA